MSNLPAPRRRGRPAKTQAEKCGTTTGYTQGCRCDACRDAINTYNRKRYNSEAYAVRTLLRTFSGRAAIRAAAASGWPWAIKAWRDYLASVLI